MKVELISTVSSQGAHSVLVFGNMPLPPGGSGKESTCQCRRHKSYGFNPWVGEDPLEKEMAAPSSILAWEIPRTEEPGGLMGHKESDMTE